LLPQPTTPIAESMTGHPRLKSVITAKLLLVLAMNAAIVSATSARVRTVSGLLVLVSATLAIWGMRGEANVHDLPGDAIIRFGIL
jgi:hypothetical protein